MKLANDNSKDIENKHHNNNSIIGGYIHVLSKKIPNVHGGFFVSAT